MSILAQYGELYRRLKTDGVEALIAWIEQKGFSGYEKEALGIIARLPEPTQASVAGILQVAEECSRGHLEFAFRVAGIGQLAREIIAAIKEERVFPEPTPQRTSGISPVDQQDVASLLASQHMMLLDISHAVSWLSTKSDIDLKAQCPFCHGPLVEVVVRNKAQGYELRLRCKDQEKSDCQENEWLVQDLTKRSP